MRRRVDVTSFPSPIAAQLREKYRAQLAAGSEAPAQPQARSKYGAKATTVDGIRFASKLESQVYERLKLAQAARTITYFLRQVPLHLPGNVRYVVDFVAFRVYGGNVAQVRYFDAKGVDTPTGKAKRRITEGIYPFHVELVTRENIDTVSTWKDGGR